MKSDIFWKMVLVWILLTLPKVALSQETYTFDRMWPVLPQPWYLSGAQDVATDNEDNLYVAEIGNNRVTKFTRDGEFITKWGRLGKGTESSGLQVV
jgi:hypothetical protein